MLALIYQHQPDPSWVLIQHTCRKPRLRKWEWLALPQLGASSRNLRTWPLWPLWPLWLWPKVAYVSIKARVHSHWEHRCRGFVASEAESLAAKASCFPKSYGKEMKRTKRMDYTYNIQQLYNNYTTLQQRSDRALTSLTDQSETCWKDSHSTTVFEALWTGGMLDNVVMSRLYRPGSVAQLKHARARSNTISFNFKILDRSRVSGCVWK